MFRGGRQKKGVSCGKREEKGRRGWVRMGKTPLKVGRSLNACGEREVRCQKKKGVGGHKGSFTGKIRAETEFQGEWARAACHQKKRRKEGSEKGGKVHRSRKKRKNISATSDNDQEGFNRRKKKFRA